MNRKVLHFLHISKTGGSALKHSLRNLESEGPFRIILHNHSVSLNDIPCGEGVVFFLRDPVSRFVSGFNSRKRQGLPLAYRPWSHLERVAYGCFNEPNDLARALYSEDVVESEKAKKAIDSVMHLRLPMSRWTGGVGYLDSRKDDIVFIGMQETLSEDFDRFRKVVGLENRMSLPMDCADAHRSPRGSGIELDECSVSNLRKWYKEDFEIIELCLSLKKAKQNS